MSSLHVCLPPILLPLLLSMSPRTTAQGLESTRPLSVSCLMCIINKGRRHVLLWLVLELKPFAWSGDAPGTRKWWFPVLVSHLLFSHRKH